MDDDSGSPPATLPAPPSRPSHSIPAREDCWSEDATRTLIKAWGRRHLDLNRGNLRRNHWLEVADAVNAKHGHVKKARRTDVQCKNRIDTLKKKYKIEKSRVLGSKGTLESHWPFFASLDALIGSESSRNPLPPLRRRDSTPVKREMSPLLALPPALSIPVGRRSKRPAPTDDSIFRRSFSAVAAAAAEMEEADVAAADGSGSGSGWGTGSGGSGSESSRSSWRNQRRRKGEGQKKGYSELARAIERFGKIYKRVEEEKQRQMIELEKQRMLFAKDLEFQRMQLYVDTQVQMEKIKRAKRSSRADYI